MPRRAGGGEGLPLIRLHFRGATITVKEGDITEQRTDAIVDAANSSLLGGGGVDGAIHRRGGPEILRECREIRRTERPEGLPPGGAVATTGGRLPARHVIHTVGPVWRGGGAGEERTLASCYVASMTLARRMGLSSVSFPSISTGAYGFPIELASRVALGAVKRFLEREGWSGEISFVLFTDSDLAVYREALGEVFERE